MTYTHIACTNERGMRVIQPFAPLQLSFVEMSDGTATAVYYIAGEAIQANVEEKFSDILEMMVSVGVAIDCTQERKWDVGQAQVQQTPNPNYGGGAIASRRFPFRAFGFENGIGLVGRDENGNEIIQSNDFRTDEIAAKYADRGMAIDNLKKQLAAKDDENEALRFTESRFKVVQKTVFDECEKIGVSPNSPTLGIQALSQALWSAKSEANRLNAQLAQKSKQIERLQKTLQEYQTTSDEMAQPDPPAHALSDEAQGICGNDGLMHCPKCDGQMMMQDGVTFCPGCTVA